MYLDLLKTSSSLEYLFILNANAIASFSEYSDLHLVKLLKFAQHGIYLLPLYHRVYEHFSHSSWFFISLQHLQNIDSILFY